MKLTVKIRFLLVVILMIAAHISVSAQRVALTTNLFEDAIATPNFGADVVLTDRQSISFDASFAPYKLSEVFHNKCMTFRAGYKFWLNQAFYSHYLGVDFVASSSDVGLMKWNFKDEYVGIGLCYGYAFIINKRLNIFKAFQKYWHILLENWRCSIRKNWQLLCRKDLMYRIS